MRSTRLALAALAATAPLALTGCPPRACNMMYAPDGVTLTFDADDWPAGEYVVEVDGQVCTVTLPATDAAVDCAEGDDGVYFELYLTQDGAGLDGGWLMESAPDPLSIRITVDDAVLFEDDLSPQYSIDEPNGEGCGERQYADLVVDIDG